MKKLLLILLTGTLTLTACKKEDIKPVDQIENPATPESQYGVYVDGYYYLVCDNMYDYDPFKLTFQFTDTDGNIQYEYDMPGSMSIYAEIDVSKPFYIEASLGTQSSTDYGVETQWRLYRRSPNSTEFNNVDILVDSVTTRRYINDHL